VVLPLVEALVAVVPPGDIVDGDTPESVGALPPLGEIATDMLILLTVPLAVALKAALSPGLIELLIGAQVKLKSKGASSTLTLTLS
jgi:hypothetical protein